MKKIFEFYENKVMLNDFRHYLETVRIMDDSECISYNNGKLLTSSFTKRANALRNKHVFHKTD